MTTNKTSTRLTLLSALALFLGRAAAAPPPTVEHVDVERYLGHWYEIAVLPNMFQGGCARDTRATYGLREDGLISVTNRCVTSSGNTASITGVARPSDPEHNSKLKVSFFSLFGLRLYLGDYWVMEVGEDYDYALVGHPTRRFGWVLARDPNPPPERVEQWLARLQDFGYDPDKFVRTPQGGEVAGP
ncbi:lipocalin family protein [Thioalkalicoccus limnaeus]|uniref:Outer membrane lipoprotein Blc n=1 Tax=Thioalkalicoccus limnaeus TaxID=120681 RepID=A0ABV4BKL4_9GAMM